MTFHPRERNRVMGGVASRRLDDSYELLPVEVAFSAGEWFVHKPLDPPGWYIEKWRLRANEIARLTRGWNVTHQSGYRCVHLSNLVDAKRCCRALKHLRLASLDADGKPNDKPGLQAVSAALALLGVRAGQQDQRCGGAAVSP